MAARAQTSPEFLVGSIVRHPRRPAWGPGKVLQIDAEGALVFFAKGGSHNGLARNPIRLVLRIAGLEPAPTTSHPRLDHLPPLVGDSVTEGESYVTLEQGIDRFLHLFPQGFHGRSYANEERDYKWRAHQEAVRLLGAEALRGLLARMDHDEVATRALRVIQRVNLLFPQEQMALRDGLAGPEHRQRFAVALFELLHGSYQVPPKGQKPSRP
jgi:hypothetical protein